MDNKYEKDSAKTVVLLSDYTLRRFPLIDRNHRTLKDEKREDTGFTEHIEKAGGMWVLYTNQTLRDHGRRAQEIGD